MFATQQHNTVGGPAPGEHGYALTLAGTWTPRPGLRFTAELLRVDSKRGQRAYAGLPAHARRAAGPAGRPRAVLSDRLGWDAGYRAAPNAVIARRGATKQSRAGLTLRYPPELTWPQIRTLET